MSGSKHVVGRSPTVPASPGGGPVVQLVPDGLRQAYGAGTWKDIAGRGIVAAAAGVRLDIVDFDPDDVPAAVALVPRTCPAVVVEYSMHFELVAALRRARPDMRILVRAHNAEALQHLHRAAPGLLPNYRNARGWYGVARLAWCDRRTARAAHEVLGISEWDERHYWRRIAPGGMHRHLPYFCPWPDLRPQVDPQAWADRDNLIICMPGGGDRLSDQQRKNLGRLAAALSAVSGRLLPQCGLTGGSGVRAAATPGGEWPSGMRRLGRVDEPWDLLCSAKAVAVLTDLGFGTKTTIVDGLAAGCHVLVHTGLVPRLPAVVRQQCLAVDPRGVDVAAVIQLLSSPPKRHAETHSLLKQDAIRTFRAAVLPDRPDRRPVGETAEEKSGSSPVAPTPDVSAIKIGGPN